MAMLLETLGRFLDFGCDGHAGFGELAADERGFTPIEHPVIVQRLVGGWLTSASLHWFWRLQQ
jgi:hypothetical protein